MPLYNEENYLIFLLGYILFKNFENGNDKIGLSFMNYLEKSLPKL